MNKKHKSRIWEYLELLLSLGIIVSTALLVLDWKAYEAAFAAAFLMAAVLFIVRAIRLIMQERGKLLAGVLYFLAATLMVAMLVGSVLTIWGGNR